MELNEVMRTTFAAREYTAEPVPDTVLYEILDNARFAPSGGNRQGNRVIIVRKPATREALAGLALPAVRRYVAQLQAGENPFNTLKPSRVDEKTASRTEVPARLVNCFREANVILVFVVDLNVVAASDQTLERVGIVGGASIYPFVWNTLLGLRQAGFGGTLTTFAIMQEPELKALLHIPDDYAVAALVPAGKPVKQLTRLKRLEVSQLAMRERFGGEPFRV